MNETQGQIEIPTELYVQVLTEQIQELTAERTGLRAYIKFLEYKLKALEDSIPPLPETPYQES
jgi:hypothetical protein